MGYFLAALQILLGAAGVPFMAKQSVEVAIPSVATDVYEYKPIGAHSRMVIDEHGFVVLKESTAVATAVPSTSTGILKRRSELVAAGILVPGGDGFLGFTADTPFANASTAAEVVASSSHSGMDVWKQVGKFLKEHLNAIELDEPLTPAQFYAIYGGSPVNWTSLAAFLGPAAIGALFTAMGSKLTADKNVRIENITKQRKEWRDHLRSLVRQINEAFHKPETTQIKVLTAELQIRLNPGDRNDNMILETLHRLPQGAVQDLDQFNRQMAALLKHDWERVKNEASNPPALTIATAVCILVVSVISSLVWIHAKDELAQSPDLVVIFICVDLLLITTVLGMLHKWFRDDSKATLKRQLMIWQDKDPEVREGKKAPPTGTVR